MLFAYNLFTYRGLVKVPLILPPWKLCPSLGCMAVFRNALQFGLDW